MNVNMLLQALKGMTDKLLVLDEKEVRILLVVFVSLYTFSLCMALIFIFLTNNVVSTLMRLNYSPHQFISCCLGPLVPSSHLRTRPHCQPYPRRRH